MGAKSLCLGETCSPKDLHPATTHGSDWDSDLHPRRYGASDEKRSRKRSNSHPPSNSDARNCSELLGIAYRMEDCGGPQEAPLEAREMQDDLALQSAE